MKTRLKKTQKSTASRTDKAVVCNRLVRRLKRIVTENGKFPYGSATRCLDVVEHVFGAHRRMCDNLQTCVQKHELGLGGEPVDEIVCAKVEELLNGNPAPIAEIEARIKAHTQPSSGVDLTHSLRQIRRTLDGSQPIDTKGAVMAIDWLIKQRDTEVESLRDLLRRARGPLENGSFHDPHEVSDLLTDMSHTGL